MGSAHSLPAGNDKGRLRNRSMGKSDLPIGSSGPRVRLAPRSPSLIGSGVWGYNQGLRVHSYAGGTLSEARRAQPADSEAAVLRGRLALETERTLAKPLLDELRAGQRKWSTLNAREKRLLEGAPLVDYLLDQSLALRHADPGGMVEFAEAAKLVADRIHPRRYGRRVLADLRARVWTVLGNAHRVADKHSAAETALSQAATWARRGTGSRALFALIEEVAAVLFSDLRRFPESIAMLDRAIAFHSRRCDVQQTGRALISRGLVTGYAGEPELAVAFLVRGLRFIGSDGSESGLRLPAIHALALNLVEAGHCAAARALIAKNERLYRRGGSLSKLRLHWLQGQDRPRPRRARPSGSRFSRRETWLQESRKGL